MTKKVFLTIIFSIVLLIGLTTISLAESSNTTVALGNEVTGSMNKTERSMDDLVDDTELDEMGRNMNNGAKEVKNAVSNGMDNIGRTMEDLVGGENDSDNMRTSDKTDSRAVPGTTGSYTSGEFQQQSQARNGMTKNAWIWIVMVVVALIIVAAVWFYAAQK